MVNPPEKPIVIQLSSVHPVFDTRIFVKECQTLSKAGYEVHLIAQHEKNEVVDGVYINALSKVQKKRSRFTQIIPQLIKKVLTYPKNSIIHFHDPELIIVGFFFKLKGYKIIYDIHEHTPKDFATKEWLPKGIRPMLSGAVYLLEYLAGAFFDGIVTVVPPVSKRFKHANNVEISNYPKLDNLYWSQAAKNPEKEDFVIYVGDITYRRGIHVMVEAIGLLESKDIGLKLGGRFSPSEIKNEIKKIKGWEKCRFVGWLSMEEIWEHLATSKAGIVTLQDVPSHRELLPVKMFEYMAMGLPVIASDFPMFRNIIEKNDCGLLVDPGSAIEIAEALKWIFAHPLEATKMGERGKIAVQKYYNWETEEKELLKFYSNLGS